MAKYSEDDYFAASTMTFGEHLDELRSALGKALLFLLVGFLVGLGLANRVVEFIKSPLERALDRYYLEADMDRLRNAYGEDAAKEMADFVKQNQFIRKNGLSFDYMYVESSELERINNSLKANGEARPAESSASDDLGAAERGPSAEQMAFTSPIPTSQFLRARVWTATKARVTALSVQETFMIWLKAGFVTGVVLASPFMFYYIWNFVAAGLYPHEQNYVYIYLPFSLGLFLLGASMAFFMVFDPVLKFLFGFNQGMNIDPEPRISEWLSFVLFLPLGFGIAFQLPLVMLFINRLGIISLSTYLDKWRIAVLAIFVIAMVLTPAEPVSMLLMAAPMTVLYFVGILMCRYMPGGGGFGSKD